jgi:hypothetical protein
MHTSTLLSNSLGAATATDIAIIAVITVFFLIHHRRHHFHSLHGIQQLLLTMGIIVIATIGLWMLALFLLWISTIGAFLLLPFAVLQHL